jgi:hypothetical protein
MVLFEIREERITINAVERRLRPVQNLFQPERLKQRPVPISTPEQKASSGHFPSWLSAGADRLLTG